MKFNIITVGLIVAVLAIGILYFSTYRLNYAQTQHIETTRVGPLVTTTDKIYLNKTYGFSLVLPVSWTKYTIQELKEADGSTVIMFGLPLETNQIAQWTSLREKKNKNFEIWSLHIMNSELWQKQQAECKNVDFPCFPPIELTRNSSYVYGSGLFFTAGGWEPCLTPEDKSSEPYFCTVYRDLLPEKGYSIEKSFKLL